MTTERRRFRDFVEAPRRFARGALDASGWFGARRRRWSAQEKAAWCAARPRALRGLRAEVWERGFESFGARLSGRLARLEPDEDARGAA